MGETWVHYYNQKEKTDAIGGNLQGLSLSVIRIVLFFLVEVDSPQIYFSRKMLTACLLFVHVTLVQVIGVLVLCLKIWDNTDVKTSLMVASALKAFSLCVKY
jgi:hypothetical protein